MSLHTLANHLQSAGRGEDKVLVHMTPGEVNGLQSLAMAHGGSLTINPETGLPEAGILKSLLPMIAGFALGPAGLGMTAMQAGLTTAAIGAASTGSLTKGLMAGLGAYSGAGLGAGLQSMAAPATAPAVPGLSPTVAANPSALAGTSPLAKVGAEDILTSTDELMGIKPGFYDPRTSSVFVKNAPVVAAPPADAAKFLTTDATNQSILGKLQAGYPGGVLPTAGANPVVTTSPSVVETVVPEPVAIKPPRADTYFDARYDAYSPVKGSGYGIRGTAGQPENVPRSITSDIYGGGDPRADFAYKPKVASGVFKDPSAVRLRTIETPVDQIASIDNNPNLDLIGGRSQTIVEQPLNRGLSGTPPAGQVFDKAQFGSRAVPSNQTVIAEQLPPLESRTSPIPIVNRSGMQTVIEKPVVRSEILPGDAPLASPRSLTGPFRERMAELGRGAKASFGSLEGLKGLYAASEAAAPYGMYAGLGSTAYTMYDEKRQQMEDEARARAEAERGLIRPYTFDYGGESVSSQPYYGSAERTYFRPTYTELPSYKAPGPEYAAKGGLMGLAVGGPVEQMAAMNAVGANTGYPMADINTPVYSNPMMQRPEATSVVAPSADAGVGAYSGEMRFARGGDTAEPESSGYTYSYDPNTTQFTQTGGPGARPSDKDLALGVGAQDMHRRFVESQVTGQPMNFTPSWAQSTAIPNGPASGGVAAPMMQPAAPAQSFIPNINIPAYQTPEQQLGLGGFYDYMNRQMGGYGGYAAGGGVSHLGDYSDGGRLLKGPGDGVSDSIPASIGNRQPARLADGEFVIPARIVSEIGNGSTEAGARKLYAMMDRVQRARRKTTGKNQVARNTKAEKLLPA